MKNEIKDIFENGGLRIYFIINNEGKRELRLLNAHRNVTDKIKHLLKDPINDFINKLDDLKDIKDAYDNTNSIYRLNEKIFNPFEFFTETNIEFAKKDIPDGFAILVGYDDKKMWIYQNIYQSAIIRSKNKVSITYENNAYHTIDNDLISFEKRIDCIKISETYLISNYKIIEKKFNYKELIRKISNEVIQVIKNLQIVEDIEKIQVCAGDDKVTFAKKLMRAKDSPVFKMNRNLLVSNVIKSKAYSKLIKNNEFVIDTKEKAGIFVRMLNDQLLKSELTGEIYDAQVKKKVYETMND